MVDTPFTIWAFKGNFSPSYSPVTRNMPDRIRDVFNVKEFGATGNGSTDDRAAIVQAMQAATNNGGGIVFFPRGNYYVHDKIIIPGDTTLNQGWGLILQGSGGEASGKGSNIFTDQRDYVLYCGHGCTGGSPVGNGQPFPIRAIVDLNFMNTYCNTESSYIASTAQTSTEPRTSPGYLDATPGPAGEEGHGCLYLGGVFQTRLVNVNIAFGTGIGLVMIAGYAMEMLNCNVIGGFPHGSTNPAAFSNLYKSIGLWLRAGSHRGSRTEGCGTAITITDGPVQIENIDIENSGYGIICGSKPLAAWNNEHLQVEPAEFEVRFDNCSIRSMGCEKIINTGFWIKTGGNATFENCYASGGGLGAAACQYGIKIDQGSNIHFTNVRATGYMENTQIDIHGADSCTFKNCYPNASGPAATWLLRTNWSGFPTAYGNTFEMCGGTDGGVLFSQLPPGQTGRVYKHMVVCTDSTLPRFSAGVSNVGKTIVGGGPNRVLAMWDGTSWTIA